MIILDSLINKENFEVNWSEVEKISEFQQLKGKGYHNIYHQEGDAYEHTKLVVQAAKKLPEWRTLSNIDKFLLLTSCLFHDIGKSVCHKQKPDGNWCAYNHDEEGEKITRYMLWDEIFEEYNDFEIRETICSLIKYHMKVKFLLKDSKNQLKLNQQVIKISQDTRWDLLYLLCKCDKLGSICNDLNESLEELEKIKQVCLDLGCFDKPFMKEVEYFSDDEYMLFNYIKEKNIENYDGCMLKGYCLEPDFTCFLMSGIPGSGKDFFIENNIYNLNLPVVSRDLIRVELGFCDINEKFIGTKQQEEQVTIKEKELIKKYCWEKKSFIHNNMNLKKKYRDEVIKTVHVYGGRIEIIYIETSKQNNIDRRKGEISEKEIIRIQESMEMPYASECHRITYNKNY